MICPKSLLHRQPLLRRKTLRRPRMNRRNLRLERRIHQPMPGQHILTLELRRDDNRHECLTATAWIHYQPYPGQQHNNNNNNRMGTSKESTYRTNPQSQHTAPAAARSAWCAASRPRHRSRRRRPWLLSPWCGWWSRRGW